MKLTLTNAAKCLARRKYADELKAAKKRKQILRAGSVQSSGFTIH